MKFVENIKNYKMYSFFIIIILTVFLTFSCLIPIYIDNQQSKLIDSTITNVPYDQAFVVKQSLFLQSDSPNFLKNTSLITKHFEFSFFTAYNIFYDQKVNYTKRYSWNDIIATSYLFMTFSNNTIKNYLSLLSLPSFNQPKNNGIIVDQTFATKYNLTVNSSFYLLHLITDPNIVNQPKNSNSNNDKVLEISGTPVNVTISKILPHLSNFGYLFITNFPTFISLSNNLIDNSFGSGEPYYKMFVTYNSSLIDNSNINNAITDVKKLSLSIEARLGTDYFPNFNTNTIFFDNSINSFDNNILQSRLTNLESQLASLQFYFLLFQIPSIIISFFLLSFIVKFWTRLKKEEYIILFKSGFTIHDIEKSIKNEFKQFLYLSFFLSFFTILGLSFLINGDTLNNNIITILQLVVDFLIYFILFRFLTIDVSEFHKFLISRTEKENFEIQEKYGIKIRRTHYILFALGAFTLVVNFTNFLQIIGFSESLIGSINNFFSPFQILILIFTPVFGLFTATVLLMFLFTKIGEYVKKKYHSRFSSIIFEDLARNKSELFHLFLLFAISFTIILGPLMAYNLIDNYDQAQMAIYYGSHYSTDFYTSNFSIDTINKELNDITNLQWSLIIKTQGNADYFSSVYNNYLSAINDIYFIYGNYTGTIVKNLKPNNFDFNLFNESSSNPMFYSYVKSSYFQGYDSGIPNYMISTFNYNNTQQNVSVTLNDQNNLAYLPGVFTGQNGYVLPFQSSSAYQYSSYQNNIILYDKLPENIQIITQNFQVKFLFNIIGPNINSTINEIESLLNRNVYTNYDVANHKFIQNGLLPVSTNITDSILVQVINFSLLGSFILIIFALLVFFSNYMFLRKRELGIYRSKGMSKLGTYKLIVLELCFATGVSLIWGLLNAILYSSSIFNLSYPQQIIQITYSLHESTILVIFLIVLISFTLLFLTTLKILNYKMIVLLKRSL